MVVNLQNVTFTPKGATQPALSLSDFRLAAGEWAAVLGGNGSGKSTLAQVLCGWFPELLPGTLTGTADIQGMAPGTHSLVQTAAYRQLVQQSPQLQLSGCAFSVEQEVAFGPENLGLPPAEIELRVNDALRLTQCDTLRHRHPATLSGGEAQRVVIAGALAMRPALLLLDEAFSRMTPAMTHIILMNLKRYSDAYGCSVILFERTLFPAADYCDQFFLLEQGTFTATGSLQAVFTAALPVIMMPDAWRLAGQRMLSGQWKGTVPHNDAALIAAFKENHVTP